MSLSDTVKSWKKRMSVCKIKRDDLANAIGVTSVTITNYVHGKTEPNITHFEKIEFFIRKAERKRVAEEEKMRKKISEIANA